MTTVTGCDICDICADSFSVMKKRMKLKEFAALNNISYRTALRHWQTGLLEGVQNGSGVILVSEYKKSPNENETPVRALMFVRCPDERFLKDLEEKLSFFAKELEVEKYDKIVWEGFAFQANPHLVDILDSNYNYIIVDKLSDIFGSNYKAFVKILESRGVEVKHLSVSPAVGSQVYEFYLSAISMAKAAVGMNSYKKRVFESASNLFS